MAGWHDLSEAASVKFLVVIGLPVAVVALVVLAMLTSVKLRVIKAIRFEHDHLIVAFVVLVLGVASNAAF